MTPIALDRHPKADGAAEQCIAGACDRIGLPTPETVLIATASAFPKAVAARRARHNAPWTGWRTPRTLEAKRLPHAVVASGHPGAGRFVGMGLCLPLDSGASS